jgi:hypothetical protein
MSIKALHENRQHSKAPKKSDRDSSKKAQQGEEEESKQTTKVAKMQTIKRNEPKDKGR